MRTLWYMFYSHPISFYAVSRSNQLMAMPDDSFNALLIYLGKVPLRFIVGKNRVQWEVGMFTKPLLYYLNEDPT